MRRLSAVALLLVAIVGLARAGEGGISTDLEDQYFKTLDGWVAQGGPIDDVQRSVVETCGKLVMVTANIGEKVALTTTQREEFHFRVDVCTKMTVHRVHP